MTLRNRTLRNQDFKKRLIFCASGIFALMLGLSAASAQAVHPEILLSQQNLQEYINDRFLPLRVKLADAKRQRQCLTQAIFHEARGEPDAGQWAVGEVILNRVTSRRYPANICDVVYQNAARRHKCQFSFACDGKSDTPALSTRLEQKAWLKAALIAKTIYQKNERNLDNFKVPQDVLFYHATTVAPRWASAMQVSAKIGHHIFY